MPLVSDRRGLLRRDTVSNALTETGTAKYRKRWSNEQKRRIVEETTREGVSVAQVARSHGISTNLLYRWRNVMGVVNKGEGEQSEYERLQSRVATLEGQMRRQTEQMQTLLSSIVTAQLVCR